ncbi:barrier-to-autointegration factor-like [Armigeres subalbatus]|uniref:barrier-to-autointegration factor-like n=1 Tax=Armigeres subalbatus TaxID=124917 RepID=UPI002ED28F84
MSSTSQKHKNFVAEPMGQKPVTDLAGVGDVLGQRLNAAGYGQASAVLGQFLVMKRDPVPFNNWMKNTTGANSKQSADCYQCLNNWCEEFL